MRKLAILLFLFTALTFAQTTPRSLAEVSVHGGNFVAPSLSLGLSDKTNLVIQRYGAGEDVQGFLSFKFAEAPINSQTSLRLRALLGGASDGAVYGVMIGEDAYDNYYQPRAFYWNATVGNIYRLAGGMAVPGRYSNWLSVNADWGKRGYGGDVAAVIVKRPFFLCDGLVGTVGWSDSLGVNIGLRTTFVLSQ